MSPSIQSRLRAWLQLVRPPNLVTVPGDPLAGALLASAAGVNALPLIPLPFVMGSSLLLYMAGLVFNDVADLEEDTRERPSRPIPSGAVSRRQAAIAATVLMVAGVLLALPAGVAAVAAAVVLALLVLCYSFLLPRGTPGACVIMGLCRGCSLLLGSAVLGWNGLSSPIVLSAAGGLTLYVTALTLLAGRETGARAPGARRWWPFVAFLLAAIGVAGLSWPLPLVAMLALLAGGAKVGWTVHSLAGTPAPARIGQGIGQLVRALLWWQAALCAVHPEGAVTALVLAVAGHGLSSLLARRFYAS